MPDRIGLRIPDDELRELRTENAELKAQTQQAQVEHAAKIKQMETMHAAALQAMQAVHAAKVTELEAQIVVLQAQIHKLQHPVPPSRELPDIEEKILIYLSEDNLVTRPEFRQVLRETLQASKTKVDYHLQTLTERQYIRHTIDDGGHWAYMLDQKGREYLVKHDLVN